MTKPDENTTVDNTTVDDEQEHNTAPESISTEDSDISPADREAQTVDANAFRASLKY